MVSVCRISHDKAAAVYDTLLERMAYTLECYEIRAFRLLGDEV